eukprot:CAMPEP_0171324314 /NCGR_PEP_ID=MMETSP0816-20121228/116106_1 /TAXON_ID=420281 /ORGANISM="Proboscia inermis, Strain CCAP1064/1" /LENGTH=232 /DNA_ID=CAMNT_0011823207 /DNA_START=410 /DNA_END=1108 /DNA_ORIENTATION=-
MTILRSLLCHLLLLAIHQWQSKSTLVGAATTTTTTTTIRGRLRLPDDSLLNSTQVMLNDGEYSTYTQRDGAFVLYNVLPGVHLLDVQSHTHLFSQVKIQLLEATETDDEMGLKCIEYAYPGASKQAIPHPLILTAHAQYQYFEPRQGFSIGTIFKNPMLIMMLFSVGLMFFMPKMMENLDDEQKEQMQKQMELQSDPTKMLSSLWGDMTNDPEAEAKKSIKGGSKARRSKRE